MAFMINMKCPCCNSLEWHCEDCWDKYHNGQKDKDYKPIPDEDWLKIKEELRKMANQVIEEDKELLDRLR